MSHPLLLALFAAALFGAWPLIARQTGLSALWVAAGISLGTAALTVAVLASKTVGQPLPAARPIGLLLLGGALNGVGMLAYGTLLGNAELDISTYVPIVLATTVLVTALGGALLFGEAFGAQKLGGLVALVAAIWLLR